MNQSTFATDDDLSNLLTFGEDDHAYQGDDFDAELDAALGPGEAALDAVANAAAEARVDYAEESPEEEHARHAAWAEANAPRCEELDPCPPDHSRAVADKAIGVLAAKGLDGSTEWDDGDDEPGFEGVGCGRDVFVRCAPGCGPVARVVGDSLTDADACNAPDEGESNCAKAAEALTEAGAFRDGWAT